MYPLVMPKMGQTMEVGAITEWLVAEGDVITQGQAIYEVETEKSNVEVESPAAGRLVRVVKRAGESGLDIGTLVAVLASEGEVPTDEEIAAFVAAHGTRGSAAAEAEPVDEATVDLAVDVAEPAASTEPTLAVPKARALARDLAIDLRDVHPVAPDGVIRVSDVRAQADAGAFPADVVASAAPVDDGVVERIPLSGVRRAMAESTARGWQEAPQFVQQFEADATALAARLKRLRFEGLSVTYTDLLVHAVARAAAEVPEVNSSFAGDAILQFPDVNVSIAVATDRGLVVPVVHQAQRMTIEQVAARTSHLAEKARAGRLLAADVSGGTITVSNLGAFGVDTGFPLLNSPQCALVFVGAVAERVVPVNGAPGIQLRISVANAYDHRVVDGMTAARFTKALRQRIEAGG